jgi:hypothetical protein
MNKNNEKDDYYDQFKFIRNTSSLSDSNKSNSARKYKGAVTVDEIKNNNLNIETSVKAAIENIPEEEFGLMIPKTDAQRTFENPDYNKKLRIKNELERNEKYTTGKKSSLQDDMMNKIVNLDEIRNKEEKERFFLIKLKEFFINNKKRRNLNTIHPEPLIRESNTKIYKIRKKNVYPPVEVKDHKSIDQSGRKLNFIFMAVSTPLIFLIFKKIMKK